ncbi:MAG TPA: 50S ribosomal protein L25/general stress protein Ctc [Longimicrobiales bacterium]|nr:50S ribosomal protein L25/general stress protein Ctc [Longimicrobiales bacterium]
MAENATLKATLREEQGKSAARRMRREGRIPAVIYGHGEETRSLSLDAHEFEMLLKRHSMDTTLIDLSIEGGKKGANVKALATEVQMHPYRAQILHVDFHQIHAGEKVTVEVPIRLVGTAAGVRAGGVLQHVLHELELECAVEAIPETIEVDVTELEVGDSVHVADLSLPGSVEVLVDADRTVCTVAAPTVLEVPEPEEEAEEPELVGEEAEEGEAAEAEASEGEPDEE